MPYRCDDCEDTGVHPSGYHCACPYGMLFEMDALDQRTGVLHRQCTTTLGDYRLANAHDEDALAFAEAELEPLPVGGEAFFDAGAGGVTRFKRIADPGVSVAAPRVAGGRYGAGVIPENCAKCGTVLGVSAGGMYCPVHGGNYK